MWRAGVFGVTLVWLLVGGGPAPAQPGPRVQQDVRSEAVIKQRKNAWTIGIAGGLIDGTYMRFAEELARVLNDGDDLRILPIVSYGAATNLEDLLYLQNVDLAITQADVFEYFRLERRVPNLASRVQYVLRLPMAELHILARDDIRTVQDLSGKKVSLGPAGSGPSLTGTIVFQRLGIRVEPVLIDNASALQKLRSGEIAALVRVGNKPHEFFAKIPPGSGLHFLSVPFSKPMADVYGIGEFTEKDYPGLVGPGQTIDTLAVPAVLAAYNWPAGSDRYRKLERFAERLFAHWDEFQRPPFHPKWREVNPAATVPGWSRFAPIDRLLQQPAGQEVVRRQDILAREFQTFMATAGAGVAYDTATEKEALFRRFILWQQSRAGGAGAR